MTLFRELRVKRVSGLMVSEPFGYFKGVARKMLDRRRVVHLRRSGNPICAFVKTMFGGVNSQSHCGDASATMDAGAENSKRLPLGSNVALYRAIIPHAPFEINLPAGSSGALLRVSRNRGQKPHECCEERNLQDVCKCFL